MTKRTLANYGHLRLNARICRPASVVFGAIALVILFANIWAGLGMAAGAFGLWVVGTLSARSADRWLAENPELAEWFGHKT